MYTRAVSIPPHLLHSTLVRLASKSRTTETGCLEWTGQGTLNGYGTIGVADVTYLVHRVAWTIHRGAVPAGLVIDHLCRNRRCINVEHCEPVEPAMNLARSEITISAQRRSRTRCKNGHPYSEYGRRRRDGGRDCRACMTESNRRYRARKKLSGVTT